MIKPNLGLRRLGYGTTALFLGVSASISLLVSQSAFATQNQLTSRSIKMSDSTASASSVTYVVSFTTTQAMQSLVIDFCANSPFIGDTTCTSAGAPSAQSASTSTSGWTAVVPGGSPYNQVKLTNSGSQSAGAQSITITGMANPSTTGTFYARITTYSNASYGTYASSSSPGNYLDYGGVAMSTADNVQITAKVQETLQFCTSAAAPTAGCAGTTTPALTLGHGSNTTLDSSATDTGTVYSQVSTNAISGVSIRAKVNNACGALSKDGGSTCAIPAVNSGSSTAATIPAGTAAFGMQVGGGTAASGGSGTTTIAAKYDLTAGSTYLFDTTTASNNLTYTFGDLVASSTGPINSVNNSYKFAATASPTTPAGIYTANLALIATGTF